VFLFRASEKHHTQQNLTQLTSNTCQRHWPMRTGGSPCRFSFRLAGSSGPWLPKVDSPHVLSSGEEVNLYCHSLELGPYRDLKRPPTHASPAVFGLINSDTSIWENRLDSLYFPVSECATYAVKELAAGYDSGKMTLGDQEAFERMGFFSSDRLTPEPRLP
jgi:hypothetical protein